MAKRRERQGYIYEFRGKCGKGESGRERGRGKREGEGGGEGGRDGWMDE